MTLSQSGHGIITVFGLLLRDLLDHPGELFVLQRQVRPVVPPRPLGPLPVLPRRHQETFRRLVDHRHLPFANHFIAMLPASGDAPARGDIPHAIGARVGAARPKKRTFVIAITSRVQSAALVSYSSIVNVTFDVL